MSALRTYFSFCIKFQLRALCPTSLTVCMFVEFLARTYKCDKSIKNIVSAIRLLHKRLHLDAPALYDFDLQLMLRAFKITLGGPRQKLPVTLDILYKLCIACDSLGRLGVVLKCVFLFAFFGFLRCSNLVPDTANDFDIHRHLSRGDVFLHGAQLVIMIKWSKTLQSKERFILLPLPSLPTHPLCPVQAFHDLLRLFPAPPNAPFFILSPSRPFRPLTAPRLRRLLAVLLHALGLSSHLYSMHSFRKGGASLCYNIGCDFARIRMHGGWTSDAVFRYIFPDISAEAVLPAQLASHILAQQFT